MDTVSISLHPFNIKNNGDQQTAQPPDSNHPPTTVSSTVSSSDSGESDDHRWATKLLRDCAAAVSDRDSTKLRHLIWRLNELASPYGDCDQKLAAYFLQALFSKSIGSGRRCYETLTAAAAYRHSFDSITRLILKFQEVSPWTTFGHVASNGAMLEAMEGEQKLHIIDISTTLSTQWPTYLEALATKNDQNETPRLKLTIVVVRQSVVECALKEIARRMEKFARLMGVPFEFSVINGIGELTKEALNVEGDEALAVNCIGALRRVDLEERESFMGMIKSLNPKIVTIVEEEADFSNSRNGFIKCFDECLRFYTTYFNMLDESFATTSNEKLMLEKECSRSIIRVLACDDNNEDQIDHRYDGDNERRQRGVQWSELIRNSGFAAAVHSDDVVDDIKALLKRYKTGWSLVLPTEDDNPGVYLAWKEEVVVWASIWKPSSEKGS